MTIVDNFTDTEVVEQNNKVKVLVYDNVNTLVVGSTCTFAFTFAGFSVDDIEEAEFIYKESLSVRLIRTKEQLVIEEISPLQIVVSSTLTNEDTSIFSGNRKVQIQVKFILKDHSVLYGEKAVLSVVSPLDKN